MWSFLRSGKAVTKGGEAAVVESVKAASEVYAPASGEVIEVNGDLEASPGTINEDPRRPRLVHEDPAERRQARSRVS